MPKQGAMGSWKHAWLLRALFVVLACSLLAAPPLSDTAVPTAAAAQKKSTTTTAAPAPRYANAAAVVEDANWIMSAQMPDGAIAHHADRVAVWPYLANFAAMGLSRARVVTGNRAYSDAAWRWLAWYQEHQDTNGFVTDYRIVNGVPVSTGDMDSTDSYAGTFLLAARYNWKATGSTSNLRALKLGIAGAVRAIEATQDADGLTWAKPAWRVKYLMDQVEAYAGLRAGAEIATAIRDGATASRATAAANRMRAGIDALWNPATNSYDWAVHETGVRTPTNWSIFYPDALQQVWAVGFGLTDASRGAALMSRFSAAFPNWDNPTALVAYDTGPKPALYRAIGGWAELRLGHRARADAAAANIRGGALAAGRGWPFTPGDSGQLVLLESGANDYLTPGG